MTLLIHQLLADLGAKLRNPRPDCCIQVGEVSLYFHLLMLLKQRELNVHLALLWEVLLCCRWPPELCLCLIRFIKPLKGKFLLP